MFHPTDLELRLRLTRSFAPVPHGQRSSGPDSWLQSQTGQSPMWQQLLSVALTPALVSVNEM